MSELAFSDVNIIGNILQTSFGTGTKNGVMYVMKGNCIIFRFVSIINYSTDNILHQQLQNCKNESLQKIEACVKNLKAEFRSEAGKVLKLKQVFDNDTLELITNGNMKKTSAFKREIGFDVI